MLFLILTLLVSCGKSTQECAEQSLIGDWNVTHIFENRVQIENGVEVDQLQITYDPPLGDFSFTKDMMEYDYTTTAKMESIQSYTFTVTKENSGFTRVNVFTIMGEEDEYRVRYGDQTSDAHEEANEISLEQTLALDTLIVNRVISLVRI